MFLWKKESDVTLLDYVGCIGGQVKHLQIVDNQLKKFIKVFKL